MAAPCRLVRLVSTVAIFDSAEATRRHAYLRSVADPPPFIPKSITSEASPVTDRPKQGSPRPPAPSLSPTVTVLETKIPTPTPQRRRLVVVNDAEELRAALQPHRLAAPLELSDLGFEAMSYEDTASPSRPMAALAPVPNAWGYSAATTIMINSAQPIELSAPLVVPAGADVRLASTGALLDSPSGRAALRGRDTRLIEVWK